MARQIELRRGDTSVSLTGSEYELLADKGWQDNGNALTIRVLVNATTLTELERRVSAIDRMISQAEWYEQTMAGLPTYVYIKTCDNISVTAEFGATWKRKRVRGGTLELQPTTGTAALPTAWLTIKLVVTELWERAKPASILETTYITNYASNGHLIGATNGLTLRRLEWLAATGLTLRVVWDYTQADCVFFSAGDGSYPMKAYYDASGNRLHCQDSTGAKASSNPLETAVNSTLDLVFKWDPINKRKAIWVNGTLAAYQDSCVLEFSLGSNLVSNNSFETHTGSVDDGISDTFTDWVTVNVNDAAGIKVEATATAQAGSKAVKLTTGAANPMLYQSIPIIPNASYKMLFYTRGDGSKDGAYMVRCVDADYNVVDAVPYTRTMVMGTTYQAVIQYFKSWSKTKYVMLMFYGPSSNGVVYFDAVTLMRNQEPDTSTVFVPSTTQRMRSLQIWPIALTDDECASLYMYGIPESELPISRVPTMPATNTNLNYRIWNIPGSAPAGLQMAVTASAADEDVLRIGARPHGVSRASNGHPVVKFECESGILGSGVSSVTDGSASGGNVARWTPSSTVWAERCTITLVTDVNNVRHYRGPWRLMLLAKDNATNVQINQIRWRQLFRGAPVGEYSDAFSLPSVGVRNLIDLGRIVIPPMSWPEDAPSAASVTNAVQVVIETRNMVGSGGGTLDLDVIYLAPADIHGTATCENWTTSDTLLIDYASDPPAPVLLDGTWTVGQVKAPVQAELPPLQLPASADPDDGSLVWLYLYRDTSYQALPSDTGYATFLVRPRWKTA